MLRVGESGMSTGLKVGNRFVFVDGRDKKEHTVTNDLGSHFEYDGRPNKILSKGETVTRVGEANPNENLDHYKTELENALHQIETVGDIGVFLDRGEGAINFLAKLPDGGKVADTLLKIAIDVFSDAPKRHGKKPIDLLDRKKRDQYLSAKEAAFNLIKTNLSESVIRELVSEIVKRQQEKTIRKFIRTILEAAQNSSDVALLMDDSGSVKSLILWKPSILLKQFEKFEDDLRWVRIAQLMKESSSEWMFGFMKLDAPQSGRVGYGAWEVKLSAAQKGYGPLLYDAAMSVCGSITASRDKVSSQAERVWDFYNKSRSDVKKLPFDDIDDPKTPSTDDDAVLIGQDHPSLDFAYEGSPSDINSMIVKNQEGIDEFDSMLSDLGIDVGSNKIESVILEIGRAFFAGKYQG